MVRTKASQLRRWSRIYLISGKHTPKDITPLVLLKFEEGEGWAIFGNRRLKALTEFRERKRHVLMDCLVWDKDGQG